MKNLLTARISASAVRTNLKLLREQVPAGTRLCPAVKSDAYGHGIDLLLDVIADCSDMLAVATPNEAIHLRTLGYDGQILIFQSPYGFADGKEREDAIAELLRHKVIFTVASVAELETISSIAERVETHAEVHVMVDTGMQRAGYPACTAPELVHSARNTARVRLTGMYTHFANADASDKSFAQEQLSVFKNVISQCDTNGLILHAANSAATIDIAESHFDMIRPGISVYGYQASDEMHNRLALQPALRLTGRLTQVKSVCAGTGCGYGLTYTFDRPSRIGLVPIGYGDGYLRCLSNRAVVGIGGEFAPLRGRVSMDQIIVDLTDIPGAEPGDEVEIISADPSAPNSVEGLARLADTIPYEVTCRLGPRISKVLVD